ncbi:MAG: class I SAM-dependent methyltransferase, partial [Thermoanaerobaculia bacterium]
DMLTAFDVVEHLTKDELFEFLDVCHEALKPGGSIVIQTPNAESPFGMRVRYGDITHEIAFDAESLRHVLEVTGFARFTARECAPVPMGIASTGRSVLWSMIRQFLRFYNLVETGASGSGIFTRVLLAKAEKMS